MIWVLEKEVFSDGHQALAEAAIAAGDEVVWWKDSYLNDGIELDGDVVFHSSLNIASQVNDLFGWSPGAFCDVKNLSCYNWSKQISPYLLNRDWVLTNVSGFVEDKEFVSEKFLDGARKVFVRPNSPLKPFAGRVLDIDDVSLATLDHGFYYDDPQLKIVVSSAKEGIEEEMRFVMCGRSVVDASYYDAQARTGMGTISGGDHDFVTNVADALRQVGFRGFYVMDVCMIDCEYKVVELNPFSGADLYHCDRERIVKAMHCYVEQCRPYLFS
jgi:hypothetical protein